MNREKCKEQRSLGCKEIKNNCRKCETDNQTCITEMADVQNTEIS